jgi:hypothetical protein
MVSFAMSNTLVLGFYLFLIWSMVWKTIALWFAGKHRDKKWFILLAILNTAGIFLQKEPLHR